MTTFTPGDRFRIYGGRVAHVPDDERVPHTFYRVYALCGEWESARFAYAHPADDRPLCKECARAMERNNR